MEERDGFEVEQAEKKSGLGREAPGLSTLSLILLNHRVMKLPRCTAGKKNSGSSESNRAPETAARANLSQWFCPSYLFFSLSSTCRSIHYTPPPRGPQNNLRFVSGPEHIALLAEYRCAKQSRQDWAVAPRELGCRDELGKLHSTMMRFDSIAVVVWSF